MPERRGGKGRKGRNESSFLSKVHHTADQKQDYRRRVEFAERSRKIRIKDLMSKHGISEEEAKERVEVEEIRRRLRERTSDEYIY